MSCELFLKYIQGEIDLKKIEEHILICPECEKALEKYVNFKDFLIEKPLHNHSEFLEKFSDDPFDENGFKKIFACSLCFEILNTYKKGFKLFKKIPRKKILNKIKKMPFKEEFLSEKISSIALSLILFFILTFVTITRGNLSLTFTKFQAYYSQSKGKTLSFYGKLLGYGANKLKEEDKNEMHKSQ